VFAKLIVTRIKDTTAPVIIIVETAGATAFLSLRKLLVLICCIFYLLLYG